MLTAAHAMETEVESVSPELGLLALEQRLLAQGRSGFPVVENGVLVGIVSRSDVVRARSVERAAEGQLADFYRSFEGLAAEPAAESAATESRIGARAAKLQVRDVMIRGVITVDRDQPLTEVARLMLDAHVHRMPVTDEGRLVGLVTTLDIVRLLTAGRLVEAEGEGAPGERELPARTSQPDPLRSVRGHLQGRLDRLLARTSKIEKDLRAVTSADSQERAVERENDEVLERLRESERRHIAQIRSALERIEAGVYAACEACGSPVGERRQAALPEATRCVACS